MIRSRLFVMALCIMALQVARPGLAAPDKPPPCRLVKIADLAVTVTPRNAILVDGSIKGEGAKFMIDTGASLTMFDSSVFSRFGVLNGGEQLRMIGVGGESTSVRTRIPDLKIGDFNGGNLTLTVSQTHFLSDDVYGLLGEDFFDSFDLDIDLAKNTFGLFEHNSCSAEPIYWTTQFSEADISVRQNRILVSIAINGMPIQARLDTGSSRSYISTALIRRMGLDQNSPGMEKAGFSRGIDLHRVDVYRYRFSEIRIGDEVVKNPVLHVANLAPIKYDSASANRIQDDNADDLQAIIGVDFIKSHHVYVATRDRKMYFTYNGGGIFSPPKDDSPGTAVAK
jgi:predicted aspartyl protease